ncbi:MAG TPA: choice-of-anchor D domain-containing protein [Candidatus Cloacimonadota bacterium]|nr:choice-of-anchor D domain-containing protein [Candidatus Cloacimonadota bacterium]
MDPNEVQQLVDFLANGGSLYIEGATIGSAGYADLYPYLGLHNNSVSVPGYNLLEMIYGQENTFLDGYTLQYMYGSVADYGIDQLDTGDGSVLLNSQDQFVRGVTMAGENYRTITSSIFFGSMADGAYTKAQIMEQYLLFMTGDVTPHISVDYTALYFGVQFAGYAVTDTLIVTNTGIETLEISDIVVSGEVFAYNGATAFGLQTAESAELELIMNASATGIYLDTLTIFSNDPFLPELAVTLTGMCVQPPIMEYSQAAFNIVINPDQIVNETLTLSNLGGYDLEFEISEDETDREISWLQLSEYSGTIDPSTSQDITLSFDSAALVDGTYLGELQIHHNDPALETVVIQLEMVVETTNTGNNIADAGVELYANYPNPFNPETTISFSTTYAHESTLLEVFNPKGQKVKQLLNAQLSAGQHSVVWNGTDNNGKAVTSGVYLYRLKCGNFQQTRKMILLR